MRQAVLELLRRLQLKNKGLEIFLIDVYRVMKELETPFERAKAPRPCKKNWREE